MIVQYNKNNRGKPIFVGVPLKIARRIKMLAKQLKDKDKA